MYVIIDEKEYRELNNLSFAPEIDLTVNTLPISELQVDIYTEDKIEYGEFLNLYDDLDNLYASYYIDYSERIDKNITRVRAKSILALLDRVNLSACMYDDVPVQGVLDDTMVIETGAEGIVAVLDYTLDSSFSGVKISGFCPEQTARERLQWVCFVIGAYVKDFFSENVEILPVDKAGNEKLIPISETFWKPTITYKDFATALTVKAYSFTAGTPQTTDKWVTDGDQYYIVTEQDMTLKNGNVPSAAQTNTVTIEGLYLINNNNASAILTRLSKYYFNRMEVNLDAINNAKYIPGEKVTAYVDSETICSGYIKRCNFNFGMQARASIYMTGAENQTALNLVANLIVLYMYETMQLDKKEYVFPVGYAYELNNPFIDFPLGARRIVFRPKTETTTGVIVAGENKKRVDYAVALDYTDFVLSIISVDSVSINENTAVIA